MTDVTVVLIFVVILWIITIIYGEISAKKFERGKCKTMEGLYVKLTDLYDMAKKLYDEGIIDDYQKGMIEIELDSVDFIGLSEDMLKKIKEIQNGTN